jgi:Entner-Doudoroff aldolase
VPIEPAGAIRGKRRLPPIPRAREDRTAMPENRAEVLALFAQHRCSAILRTPHATAVLPAMSAAVEGGFRIVELTLTTPGALDAIRHFARQGLLVGAGTVLTLQQAGRALDAGARFLVSPVFDPAIVRFCTDHDLVAVPGTATPTEMWQAHQAGADVVKLFPAPAGGPDFVRSVRGPMPFLRIFPTGGITEANIGDWFAAGAFGLGFVHQLFAADDLAAARYEQVALRARRFIEAVTAARS